MFSRVTNGFRSDLGTQIHSGYHAITGTVCHSGQSALSDIRDLIDETFAIA